MPQEFLVLADRSRSYVRPFILGLFFAFGACGIYVFYATL